MPESMVLWFDGTYFQTIGIHVSSWSTSSSILSWLIFVFTIICLRKIFNKAHYHWRGAIIPIYNVYLWLKTAGRSWWRLLTMIFPPLFGIVMIVSFFDVSKRFWQSWLFALWLLLINPIFLWILAFWNAKYSKK